MAKRTAESVLLGDDSPTGVNLTRLAPAVGCSPAALCRWRKTGFPESVRVFARICRARGLTDEQIGQIVRSVR